MELKHKVGTVQLLFVFCFESLLFFSLDSNMLIAWVVAFVPMNSLLSWWLLNLLVFVAKLIILFLLQVLDIVSWI